MNPQYEAIAMESLKRSLKVKDGEEILVIADELTLPFGEAFRAAASKLGNKVCLLLIPVAQTDGFDPPDAAGAAMLSANVIIAATKYTLTHCKAIKKARASGARCLSIPNINETLFLSPAMTLSREGQENTIRASELFTLGERVHVTTKAGTDLSFGIGGWNQVAGIDNGLIEEPGMSGNLPAGESFIVPAKGTGNGVVVVNCSVSGGLGILTEPIRLTIENGLVVRAEGGEQAKALEKIFDTSGENSRNLAEFAVGLNINAKIIGAMVMDEKLLGTAHIGIGNSECLGGDTYAKCHIDALFAEPTIDIDGELMAENGKLFLGGKTFEDYRNYPGDKPEGPTRLKPENAAVVENVLCRKWKDAFGKTYFTKVGIAETAQTVLAHYNALLEGRGSEGQEDANKLNRLLIRYGIISAE